MQTSSLELIQSLFCWDYVFNTFRPTFIADKFPTSCPFSFISVLSGDVDAAVELLDGIYTAPNSTNPSMAFIFRKLLESGNDQALDKRTILPDWLN